MMDDYGCAYSITAAVFAAFLRCPTKAYLLAIGEPTPQTFFADIEARISSTYSTVTKHQLRVEYNVSQPLDFNQIWRGVIDSKAMRHYVNCDTAVYDLKPARDRLTDHQLQRSTSARTLVPVLFLPSNKADIADNLRLCFAALALSQRTGIMSAGGTLIYGDGPRYRTVKINDYVDRTRQAIELILAPRGPSPPQLILNRHCAVCDFQ